MPDNPMTPERLAEIEVYLAPYRDPSITSPDVDYCDDHRALRLAGCAIELTAALRAAWERERGWERTARQIVEWGPTTSSDRYMHTCWLLDALEGRFRPEDEDDEAATPAPSPAEEER